MLNYIVLCFVLWYNIRLQFSSPLSGHIFFSCSAGSVCLVKHAWHNIPKKAALQLLLLNSFSTLQISAALQISSSNRHPPRDGRVLGHLSTTRRQDVVCLLSLPETKTSRLQFSSPLRGHIFFSCSAGSVCLVKHAWHNIRKKAALQLLLLNSFSTLQISAALQISSSNRHPQVIHPNHRWDVNQNC